MELLSNKRAAQMERTMIAQSSLDAWQSLQAVLPLREHQVYSALCEEGMGTCSQISTRLMTKGVLMPPNNINRRLRSLEKQGLVRICAKLPKQVWITTNRMEMNGIYGN